MNTTKHTNPEAEALRILWKAAGDDMSNARYEHDRLAAYVCCTLAAGVDASAELEEWKNARDAYYAAIATCQAAERAYFAARDATR